MVVTSVITLAVSSMLFLEWKRLNSEYVIAFDPQKVNKENIEKFNIVRSVLRDRYYADVDENKMLEGAIAGMTQSLGDVYTVYYTKEQMQRLMEISNKSEEVYVGIGVSVMMDNNGLLTVVEPFEGSPAAEVGIMPGDRIVKVNGEDVTFIKDEDLIINKIKGPENTYVNITVYRPSEGKNYEFNVQRRKVKYAINLRSEVLENNIGYIRIISFNDRQISRIFNEALDRLLAKGIKGLIIDVRDNPGGYYDGVVKIADRLLPEGIIVYTEDKEKNQRIEKSDETELGLPMVVLINGRSASASEVLAGAIKDHKKGMLVGTTTFGKGLVQDIIPLNDGSGLKVTTARHFTPSGVCIHGVGIQPDVEVRLDDEYKDLPISQIPRGDDNQLMTALEILRAKVK
ncbi:MAG TPA: S41 family peptidase [Clostridiaceae bacterium]|nr:S41 family peptidase [Clostridiaceae bacterium]